MVPPWLSAIGSFFSTNAVKIIALIIYTILLNLINFVPNKYRLDKKIVFALKVREAICSIDVSVPVRKDFSRAELIDTLNRHWRVNKQDDVTGLDRDSGEINFNSSTGASYKINLVHDDDEDERMVTFHSYRGFSIGLFGGVKRLDDTLDELSSIVELFPKNKEKHVTITAVDITPRYRRFCNSPMQATYKGKNVTLTLTSTHLEISHNGFGSIKKNVTNGIYEWRAKFF